MSKLLDGTLQGFVNCLVQHGFTDAQQIQAKEDLAMIAVRCFCEGRVGPGRGVRVLVQGHTVELDGVDLTLLLQSAHGRPLTLVDLQNAAQQRVQGLQSPQAIALKNPEHAVHAESNQMSGADIQKMLIQRNVRSPFYKEMLEMVRVAPVPPLDHAQKILARQVLDMLPEAAQGSLRNVPVELIGARQFVEVMRAAAHQKQLPARLQEFRDSCLTNDAMKKAIYQDPYIAARVMGFTMPASTEGTTTSQALAKKIAGDVLVQCDRDLVQRSAVGRFMQRVVAPMVSDGVRFAIDVFLKLGKFEGFRSQNMADVPSCFNDMPCPEATRVNDCAAGPLKVHANWVSLGDGRQVVAAMPPWHEAGEQPNDAEFFKMIAGHAPGTVLDLRSNGDFQKGAFNYCPAEGSTRSLKDPASGNSIAVKTVRIENLPIANCRALMLHVTIGRDPPRQVKVIQFRAWPDHGVVSPAVLRQLRQLLGHELAAQQAVVTHCRAGVGRTGTLLAYEHLHHKLIGHGEGRTLVDAAGVVNKRGLLQAIAEVVAQGRIERGPYFVQSQDQFLLLYQTLKQDLATHAEALHTAAADGEPLSRSASASALPLAAALYAAPARVGVGNYPPSSFSPEPASTNEGAQHWLNILDRGEDVLEIISRPNRVFGDEQATANASGKGLGVALAALLKKTEDGQEGLLVGALGPYQVTVRRLPADAQTPGKQLVQSQRIEVWYQKADGSPAKRLLFTQMLTHYDRKKLTVDQLDEGVSLLREAGYVKPKWLSSVRGGGRPSALLVAQAMRLEIANGNIKTEAQLQLVLDDWIAQGRSVIGPLFVNTQEQQQALIDLGKRWIAQHQTVGLLQPEMMQ
ncbi:MAG TPA: protein-tyrosine phosphatase family protein [Limnobacter sp.]|nr:protein-tyrosine phosphatase family protein [Limnobacter sp.]